MEKRLEKINNYNMEKLSYGVDLEVIFKHQTLIQDTYFTKKLVINVLPELLWLNPRRGIRFVDGLLMIESAMFKALSNDIIDEHDLEFFVCIDEVHLGMFVVSYNESKDCICLDDFEFSITKEGKQELVTFFQHTYCLAD